MCNFLKYLKTGKPNDSFTKELNESVEYARQNKEWKEEYRMMNMQERVWKQDARVELILKLISKGKLTVDAGAEELGMSTSEVEEAMQKAGIKIPELA